MIVKLSICEYESIFRKTSEEVGSEKYLEKDLFDDLENFILENRYLDTDETADASPLELLSISSRHGRKTITAKNYVGVIEFEDGSVLEILPKIAGSHGMKSETEIRNLLLEMLEAALEIKEKRSGSANLDASRMNILEVFISMFLEEVNRLVQNGLKSTYSDYSGNENFIRGRINFSENIRHNLVHKERVFVEYQVYGPNRPENRIIKSTLNLLMGLCRDVNNQRLNRMLLSYFDDIPISTDYISDFSYCENDRNMCDYNRVLPWCELFLNQEGLHIYSGTNVAYAFLFPMEYVFESYVAHMFRLLFPNRISVSSQDSGKRLFGRALRPDIVLRNGDKTLILDTKWKLPSKSRGASVQDLYQMYAYSKKYDSKNIILLYPADPEYDGIRSYVDEEVNVFLEQIDLFNFEESLESLISTFDNLLVE